MQEAISDGRRPRRGPLVWCVAAGLLLVVGLALLGMAVDYMPIPALSIKRCAGPLIVVSLVLSCVLPSPTRWAVVPRYRNGGWITRAFLTLATPFAGLLLCWCAIAKGVPWIYTGIAGTAYQQEVVLRTEEASSRGRGCAYRLVGDAIEGVFPGRLCISGQAYERYPDQSVVVRLRGSRSALGTRIDAVLIQRAAADGQSESLDGRAY